MADTLEFYQLMLKETQDHLLAAQRAVMRAEDQIVFYRRKIEEADTTTLEPCT